MRAALLYRTTQKWQICASFFGAVLIHVTAVSLANVQPAELIPPTVAGGIDAEFVETTPEPLSNDDAEQLPPPPQMEDSFQTEIEVPAPPRKRRTVSQPVRQVVRQTAQMRSARVLAMNAPRPEYPYEARRQRLTGSGMAVLTIDFASGSVLDVTMTQSTGSAVLDHATVSAFRRWRFRPGTISKVQSPITFTLTGASY